MKPEKIIAEDPNTQERQRKCLHKNLQKAARIMEEINSQKEVESHEK